MKHGGKVLKLKWVDQLKIALIEKDETKIEKLVEQLPSFNSIEEMKEAAYMMQEAHDFLTSQKEKLATNLLKIKKQKEFLDTANKRFSSFDKSL